MSSDERRVGRVMDTDEIRACARAKVQADADAGLLPPIPAAAYGAIALMRIETKQPQAKAEQQVRPGGPGTRT